MTKDELIKKVIENLCWEGMYMHVWKTDEEGIYYEEITNQDCIYDDDSKEDYLGKINLLWNYWSDNIEEMREDEKYMLEAVADVMSEII